MQRCSGCGSTLRQVYMPHWNEKIAIPHLKYVEVNY
jgi:uncharacterized protein with PIN domain